MNLLATAAHTLLELALLLHWLQVMTWGPEDPGGTISVAMHHQDSLRYDYRARVGCWYELRKITGPASTTDARSRVQKST